MLAISLVVTGFVCYAANRYEQERVASLFVYRSDRDVREIQGAFGAQEAALRAAAGLIEADDGFSRARWRAYFRHQPPPPLVPGLEAVGYAPRVLDSERAAHEAQVREDGVNDYVVSPGLAIGRFPDRLPAGAAREPAPVAMGYDIASNRPVADVRVSAGTARRAASGSTPAPGPIARRPGSSSTRSTGAGMPGLNPAERAQPQGSSSRRSTSPRSCATRWARTSR